MGAYEREYKRKRQKQRELSERNRERLWRGKKTVYFLNLISFIVAGNLFIGHFITVPQWKKNIYKFSACATGCGCVLQNVIFYSSETFRFSFVVFYWWRKMCTKIWRWIRIAKDAFQKLNVLSNVIRNKEKSAKLLRNINSPICQ